MLVSVGIPTFNRPVGLERTLHCITSQTYKDLEIIISDNGSDPETKVVVEKFSSNDNRIKYIRHEVNQGMQFNFKCVLEFGSGDYFMWAADDDEWDNSFIEECMNLFQTYPNAGSVMTGINTINRTSGKIIDLQIPAFSIEEGAFNSSKKFIADFHSSLFYGIHKRKNMLFMLQEEFYDFLDCHVILRQILNNGFVVRPEKKLYYAGINESQYVYKPFRVRAGKNFTYHTFLINTSREIIRSQRLNKIEKLKLIYLLTEKMSGLFTFHERKTQPIKSQLAFYSNALLYKSRKIIGF